MVGSLKNNHIIYMRMESKYNRIPEETIDFRFIKELNNPFSKMGMEQAG